MGTLIRSILVLFLTGFSWSCSGSPDSEELFTCAPERFENGAVIALTTNYETSSVDLFHPDCPNEIRKNLVIASGDAALRSAGGLPVILNRGAESNLIVLDKELTVVSQIPLPGCGPHDLLSLDEDTLLVSCYESAHLQQVSISTGVAQEVLDLSSMSGVDGIPEMDALSLDENYIYLTLQNLDRQNNWSPEESGKVVVLSRADLQVVHQITLPCSDPFTRLVPRGAGTLLVGCAGTWSGDMNDAGIVEFDVTNQSATLIYDADALQGRPTFIGEGVAEESLVVTAQVSSSNRWDIESMKVLVLNDSEVREIYAEPGFSLGGVQALEDDQVLIALRSLDERGGIFLMDTKTLEIQARWTTGLLPSGFIVAR